MKTLLAHKADYKKATGKDYKPGAAPASSAPADKKENAPASGGPEVDAIVAKITTQGDKVRTLKSNKADKVCQTRVKYFYQEDHDIS